MSFGPEGLRAPAMTSSAFTAGPLHHRPKHRHLRHHYRADRRALAAVWLYALWKALRATAVNRLGARIVGIRTSLSGQIAFLLAAIIGAISGISDRADHDAVLRHRIPDRPERFYRRDHRRPLVSYPLTAVAALVVGTVEAFSSFYASNFKEVIVFTLILPVLILRSLASPVVEEEED